MTLETCPMPFNQGAELHLSDVIHDRGFHWNLAPFAEGSLQEMVSQWTKMPPEDASRATITTRPIDVGGAELSWLCAEEIKLIATRPDFPEA